jgi:formylglycine-generating enzyme required for sulfatase activity/serine/threonine protein kinase
MSPDPSASSPPVTPTPAGDTKPAAAAPPSRDRFPFLDPPQQSDEIGRLPGYRILGVLGEGGMGCVFRAEDVGASRSVAIKVVKPSRGGSDEDQSAAEAARQRFAREARAAARLEHDHVVAVYFVGEHNGAPYVVMPLLKGESLHARLRRGRLTVGEACRIAREAAEGLAAAHDEKLVHRDIKPANLWLEGKRGRVKVLDFGLARSADDTTMTASGQMFGTPAYMAPEQARDAKRADARADLFSLGCVLYEMLAGRPPFAGDSYPAVLSAVLMDEPTPVQDANADVSSGLAELTHRLLAKRPDGRPTSATEVAEALRAWETPVVAATPAPAAAAPIPLTPAPTPPGPSRNAPGSTADTLLRPPSVPVPRRRGVGVMFGVTLLALMAGAAVTYVVIAPPASPTPPTAVASRPTPPLTRTEPSPPTKPATSPPKATPPEPVAPPPMPKPVVPPPPATKPAAPPRATTPEPAAPKPPVPAPVPAVVRPVKPKPLDCTGPNGVTRAEVERAQHEWAKYLGSPVEITDEVAGVKFEFVLVPPGRFVMGAPASEIEDLLKQFPDVKREWVDDVRQHEVVLTKPFYLGKYEVTQQQYQAVADGNPSWFTASGDRKKKVAGEDTTRFPVETVSWEEATDYAKSLTRRSKDGQAYRLPTEAEWEYSCRGGRPSSQPFGIGDGRNLSSTQANFDGNQPYGGAAKGPYLERTCRVGSYPANGLGLYDMHGNVWEWCADWYDKDYPQGKVTDPEGPREGAYRVYRGGGWFDDGGNCRSANRNRGVPGYRSKNLGFRLARSSPSGPSE